MNIRHFSIKNLHGCWDFEVPIEDNTLVIVGENGYGIILPGFETSV